MTTIFLPTIDHLRARAKSHGSKPQWFGLGFVQLKLSDTERMHFWCPEIPSPEREEIHNHRYDFGSVVLAGNLLHDVYHLDATISTDAPDRIWLDAEWEVFETNCAPGKEGAVETVTPCLVTQIGKFELERGSTYEFPHTSFHTTEGTRFAITHLTRVLPRPLEYASVIKRRGAETTCPFKEKMEPEACWEHIYNGLVRAGIEDQRELNSLREKKEKTRGR
jgi:hypothetical protein